MWGGVFREAVIKVQSGDDWYPLSGQCVKSNPFHNNSKILFAFFHYHLVKHFPDTIRHMISQQNEHRSRSENPTVFC